MITMAQCWEQLTEAVRRKMVAHHSGVTERDLPHRLVEADYWQTYQQALSEDEWVVCRWLALQRGEEGVSLRQLKEGGLPLPLVPFQLALTRLRQRGIVFAGRQTWGETVYVVPTDVRTAWLQIMFPRAGATQDEQGDLTRQAPYGVLHDLFHWLVMIDHTDVKLTDRGTVHQRIQQKMNVELEIPTAELQGADWLTEKVNDVTAFHIVFRLAEQTGLVKKGSRQNLALVQERLDQWLLQSHQEATNTLYDEVKRMFLSVYPRNAAIVWWMEQQSGWVAVREMAMMWMQQLNRPIREWRSFADDWTRKWLEPLHGLGWLDWGEDRFGTVWRWSVNSPFTPVQQTPVCESYVQPNFEWLLPLHFPLRLRWQAAQFADLLQTDHLCIYDINANAVQRAAMKGWTGNDICQFLQEHSVTPVPQNVEASIRQWAVQSRNVRFERIVLMTCQDEHTARTLVNDQSINKWLKKRINETHYVVDEENVQQLRLELEKEGYMPVGVEALTSSETTDEGGSDTAAVRRKGPLRIENSYPDLEEAVPGLATLPKMWISGMREYHRSTLLKLVKRAVDMQLGLEWNNRVGKEAEFIQPVRLLKDGTEWKVTGVDRENRERHIRLSEVRQVKIKLPDSM